MNQSPRAAFEWKSPFVMMVLLLISVPFITVSYFLHSALSFFRNITSSGCVDVNKLKIFCPDVVPSCCNILSQNMNLPSTGQQSDELTYHGEFTHFNFK